MNLYLISQTANHGYDTYDSAVVVAEDEEQARNMDPADGTLIDWNDIWLGTWASQPEQVTVIYLGELDNEQVNGRVICASFNAG